MRRTLLLTLSWYCGLGLLNVLLFSVLSAYTPALVHLMLIAWATCGELVTNRVAFRAASISPQPVVDVSPNALVSASTIIALGSSLISPMQFSSQLDAPRGCS